MICPYCGSSIAEGTKFCPECGKKLEVNTVSDVNPKICPFCGEVLEPDSVFCDNCGRALSVQPSPLTDTTAGSAGSAGKAPVPPVPPLPASARPSKAHESARSRSKKTKTIPVVIAAVLVVVLTAVIAFRYSDSIRMLLKPDQGMPQDQIAEMTSAETSGLIPENTTVPEASVTETTASPEPAPETTAIPASAAETTSSPEPVPETAAPEPAPEEEPALRYDPLDYETFQQATLADFEWANTDILHGRLPDGIERITNFEEIKGGWKLYIIDDPDGKYGSMMERLCRCAFGEDSHGPGIAIRWDYVHNNATDEGFDDNTPDSFYYGTWENGTLDALGAGSVKITDCWYKDGLEYAVGTMTWPDGIPAAMFLVRP